MDEIPFVLVFQGLGIETCFIIMHLWKICAESILKQHNNKTCTLIIVKSRSNHMWQLSILVLNYFTYNSLTFSYFKEIRSQLSLFSLNSSQLSTWADNCHNSRCTKCTYGFVRTLVQYNSVQICNSFKSEIKFNQKFWSIWKWSSYF